MTSGTATAQAGMEHAASDPPAKRLRICLINPKFRPSYWGMDFALPMLPGDMRNFTATGALPALAALCPDFCDVTLVDENVEDIDFAALSDFDIVGVTGMIVQRDRMFEILERLGTIDTTVIVGGPYVSVSEAEFADVSDVRFVGEAEQTWPVFLTDFARGAPTQARYAQADKTDMTTVPAPRYDLLPARHYMSASLQFSRGCPFLCEFCDIITIFGRRPRTKTPAQMIAEFDGIRQAGFRHCFLVDDNFIGNKKKALELLEALVVWQEQNGFPLSLTTEASIDLADAPELLDLMVRANFRQVFVGIESPRPASLQETRKIQNVRGDSMLDKLQRIRDAGLVIQAGFIVGFDNDDADIFDEQFAFIQQSGIAQALVGILAAIPTTPLYDRLAAEGRLVFDDPDVNFHPKQMTKEALKAGYDGLMLRLYQPDAYFDRLLGGYAGSPAFRRIRSAQNRRAAPSAGRLARLGASLGGLISALRLARALRAENRLSDMGSAYWRHWRRNRRLGKEAAIPFAAFVRLCTEHWHFFNISISRHKGAFGAIHTETATEQTGANRRNA